MNNQKQKINKTALYCRVASASPEDAHAIEQQRDTLRSFAQQQGFTDCVEYLDNGYSGLNLDRPAFKQMEADIQAGAINAVIIRNISRIARNYILCNQWIDGLDEYGVKLIAVDSSHENETLEFTELFITIPIFAPFLFIGEQFKKIRNVTKR